VRAQTDWSQHLSLVDGWKDYPGIKVRAETTGYGISAISALSEIPLIKQAATLMGALLDPLLKFGYEPGKNLRAFPYDVRLDTQTLVLRIALAPTPHRPTALPSADFAPPPHRSGSTLRP